MKQLNQRALFLAPFAQGSLSHPVAAGSLQHPGGTVQSACLSLSPPFSAPSGGSSQASPFRPCVTVFPSPHDFLPFKILETFDNVDFYCSRGKTWLFLIARLHVCLFFYFWLLRAFCHFSLSNCLFF